MKTAIRSPLAPVAHDANLLRPLLDRFEHNPAACWPHVATAAAMSLPTSYSTKTSSGQ